MGASTEQIEQEIRAERDDLGRNLEDLEFKAKELADWKVHFRNHPAAFLGAAAGFGVLLGALAPSHVRPPREPIHARGTAFRALAHSPKVEQLRTTWGHISDALLGVATAKAVDAIADYLPGFRDQYERQSARTRS
jgi:hypothetical protein